MTAPADPTPPAAGVTAAPRRVYRRSIARRFVCRSDPAWALFHDVACIAGVLAALAGVLLQQWPAVTVGVVLGAVAIGLRLGVRRWRSRAAEHARAGDATHLLRWDGAHWWWRAPLPQAGAPLAVEPVVLLDLERWMLLQLRPVDAGGRFWRYRLLAVARRHRPAHWSLLRVHLFMARAR